MFRMQTLVSFWPILHILSILLKFPSASQRLCGKLLAMRYLMFIALLASATRLQPHSMWATQFSTVRSLQPTKLADRSFMTFSDTRGHPPMSLSM